MSGRNSYNVAPIPGDNNGGSGGGGGEPVLGSGVPIGSVIPFAGVVGFNGSFGLPDKWLLCDGREVRTDTYADLYNVIGLTYGVAPSVQVQFGIGNYSYNNNTISGSMTTANVFLKVGTYIRPTGFNAGSGADLNGTWILIATAPAIGGTGVFTGTFAQPIAGVGSGNTTGTFSVNRASITMPNLVSKFPLGASTITGPANASTGGSATTTLTADNLPQHTHQVYVPGNTAFTSGSGQTVGFPNTTNVSQTTVPSQTRLNDGTTLATNSAFSTLNPYLALNYIIKAEN